MHDAQESRARAEGLLSVGDAMQMAVVAVGDDERIILFNKAAQRMFRVGSDDVIGLPMRRLFPRPTGEPFIVEARVTPACSRRRDTRKVPRRSRRALSRVLPTTASVADQWPARHSPSCPS
jgi:PAS domain-containing protein